MLSPFQRQKIGYLFDLLDLNKDGRLHLENISDISEKICEKQDYERGGRQHQKVTDLAVGFFHTFLKGMPDAADHAITRDAWIGYFEREVLGPGDDDVLDEYSELILGFMFGLLDENRDGYISRSEYQAVFELYGIDDRHSGPSFKNIDVNDDGFISRYELIHAIFTFLTSDDPTDRANWLFGKWD